MHDYDVGVLVLQSPPPASVLTPYRPAVTVRNNGVHDALASGYLRIYSAGRLIFSTELYSATIPPGETRQALGVDYWTPPAEGTYIVNGYVSCPLDQYEPNNNLAPASIIVSGEPAPPPTPVTPHASQHEEGQSDEIILDGLHGRLADTQTPSDHAKEHQVGGSDVMRVDGLSGTLADPQEIRDHHSTHENDGGDEMNVDDLHGVLYNKQKPQTHANEAHDPNYAATPHGNEAHTPDFMKALKTPGQTGDSRALTNHTWKTLESVSLTAGLLSPHDVIEFHASGYYYMNNPDRTMQWKILLQNQDELLSDLGHFYDIPVFPSLDGRFDVHARLFVGNSGLLLFRSGIATTGPDLDHLEQRIIINATTQPTFDVSIGNAIKLLAMFDSEHAEDSMTILTSSIRFVAGS
jgi:hypothetical protein